MSVTGGFELCASRASDGAVERLLMDMDAELKFGSTKADVGGGLGYVQGTYTMAGTDPKTKKRSMEKGNYVTIYKKQADGAWKIVEDINTPDSEPM